MLVSAFVVLVLATVSLAEDAPCIEGEPGYYADPNNCIKYYHCFANHLNFKHLTCEKDEDTGTQLFWAPEHDWCDFPERVNCGDRPICDENDENCYTPSTTTTDPNAYQCNEGDGYFEDPLNCIKYYHCFAGQVEEHLTCQKDTSGYMCFDPVNQWCDHKDNVDCGSRPYCDENDENCDFTLPPGSTTTAGPDTTTTTKAPDTTTTTKAPDSTTTNAPDSTTTNAPGSTTTNAPDSTTTAQITTTSKGSTTTGGSGSHCDSLTNNCANGDGYYTEGKCQACFCQCANNIAEEQCCDSGLVWNQDILACDFPDNVQECA